MDVAQVKINHYCSLSTYYVRQTFFLNEAGWDGEVRDCWLQNKHYCGAQAFHEQFPFSQYDFNR